MQEYGFSLTIVLIQVNTDQRKPVFWHILSSVEQIIFVKSNR